MSKPKARSLDSYSNRELYEMLLDGRLHDVVGYGVKYMAIVTRLIQAGYPVQSYKWRVVSGKPK